MPVVNLKNFDEMKGVDHGGVLAGAHLRYFATGFWRVVSVPRKDVKQNDCEEADGAPQKHA